MREEGEITITSKDKVAIPSLEQTEKGNFYKFNEQIKCISYS